MLSASLIQLEYASKQGKSTFSYLEDEIKILDPRVQKLIRTYLEVFGELPPSSLL